METTMYNSLLFKNIFKNYQDFKNWYTSTPLSDSVEDVPSEKTFTLIAYEYNDSSVNSSIESFKQRFANDVYTYYKAFEATTKAIDELMRMTDEEISVDNNLITNLANIPEYEVDTNVDSVNFVSSQQKTISKKGNLQIKREQLSNKRTYTVKTFINRFRHLFIKILSPSYTYVVGEEEGE